MCDTLVALPEATSGQGVIFAKNSDREPNEAQALTYLPGAQHAPGAEVRCTFTAIPQTAQTYAVLLGQPFWMWGAEMGVNEHGVAIGNESVFTREPYVQQGLSGMDLVRLGLERGATARAALETITTLLMAQGQHASGGYQHTLLYHNTFLIADPREAWVLETAGQYWAARQVREPVYTISNAFTIGADWDLASEGLVEHAIAKGWCRSARDFDFARCYSDPLRTRLARGRERRTCSTGWLHRAGGQATVQTAMAALRDHGPRAAADPRWTPAHGSFRDLCVHGGFGPLRSGQTVNTLVAQLDPALATVWMTGAAAPCTGIFKPLWVAAGPPAAGPPPGAVYTPESLWWRHERLHRAVLAHYPTRLAAYREERDALEAEFIAGAQKLAASALPASALPARGRALLPAEQQTTLAAFSAAAFRRADAAAARWLAQVEALPAQGRQPLTYRLIWARYNRQVGL